MSKRVVTYDLHGWKQIADAIGVSERTVMRYADLDDDPLPVSRFFGRVRARRDDLRTWIERREDWSTSGADAA